MLVSWAPVMTEHVCLPCWQFWFIFIALALAPTTNIGQQCVARRIRGTCRRLAWSHRCRQGPHGWICYCVCISKKMWGGFGPGTEYNLKSQPRRAANVHHNTTGGGNRHDKLEYTSIKYTRRNKRKQLEQHKQV